MPHIDIPRLNGAVTYSWTIIADLCQDVPLRLNFNDMTSDNGLIQRLSTPSYVEIRDKVDATRWLWYWHDGADWIPYGQVGSGSDQVCLESISQSEGLSKRVFQVKSKSSWHVGQVSC